MDAIGQERRLRVHCHLPNHEPAEMEAFGAIVTYLHTLRTSPFRLTGLTQADRLLGQWWSDEFGWIEDTVTVLTVDFELHDDPAPLDDLLTDLKEYAHICYAAAGAHQEEIWVVAHPITRYLGRPKHNEQS